MCALRKRFDGLARILSLGITALLLAAPASAQVRVKQLNLAQLVDYSRDIVRGRVLSVKTEKHPTLPNTETVVVTLQVEEALKGTASGQFSFRQVVWNALDRGTTLGYKAGEDVLLMLLPPSEYGLTSPAGFEQGRFLFRQGTAGNLSVSNEWNNRGLMSNLGVSVPQLSQRVSTAARTLIQTHREGPVDYTQFKEIIRGVIAARQ